MDIRVSVNDLMVAFSSTVCEQCAEEESDIMPLNKQANKIVLKNCV